MSFITNERSQMRTLRWVLVGVVAVLVSCGGGSSSSNSEEPPTPTNAGVEVVYKVGDTGPGGGTIVYVDEAGFDNSVEDDKSIGAMCMTGTCHYLEMAPTDLGREYPWEKAIVAAEAFSTASANDWILPSKDALNEMCKYGFGDSINVICNDDGESSRSFRLGGFSTVYYWSSSEPSDSTASAPGFSFRGQYFGFRKSNYGYVRPVRAF
jgi:hypothetical protein